METAVPVMIALVWCSLGVFSDVYWVTKNRDYTTDDIGLALMSGVIGPLAWLVGWTVYGEPKRSIPRVLLRRRS